MDVLTQRRDLTKGRHTHVRDNIHHLQASHMRTQHAKYYFLVSQGKTRQDNAVRTERNVFEAIRKVRMRIHTECRNGKDWSKSAETLQNTRYTTVSGKVFFSGSRGLQRRIKV